MLAVSSKVFSALSLLKPYDIDIPKRMVGSERDGAYVLADQLAIGDILSIGIDHNDDFDFRMAEEGYDIYMFDHTVDGPPHQHPKFNFHRVGVCGGAQTVADLITIETMIERCSLRRNSILKIDVEGAEWDVFSTISANALSHFDQIVVEVHWLDRLRDNHFRWSFCEALRRINSQFTLFHVHGNNNGDLSILDGFTVAAVLELSYVRSSLAKVSPSRTVYPAYPNRANHPNHHDLPLLFYPFLPVAGDERDIASMVHRIEQDFDCAN